MNNFASSAATNSIFGNDLTLGSFVGSFAGGLVRGQLPAYQGVAGGSLVNGIGEILHMGATGAVTGAVGGSVGALVDRKSIKSGFINGSLQGALGGATQAALNIAFLGPTYDSRFWGDDGPVLRRGPLPVRLYNSNDGNGIALGRNLVVIEKTGINPELRFHEYTHYLQQRELGFGGYYERIMREYYQVYKDNNFNLRLFSRNYYKTPGHLENQSYLFTELFKNFHRLPR